MSGIIHEPPGDASAGELGRSGPIVWVVPSSAAWPSDAPVAAQRRASGAICLVECVRPCGGSNQPLRTGWYADGLIPFVDANKGLAATGGSNSRRPVQVWAPAPRPRYPRVTSVLPSVDLYSSCSSDLQSLKSEPLYKRDSGSGGIDTADNRPIPKRRQGGYVASNAAHHNFCISGISLESVQNVLSA